MSPLVAKDLLQDELLVSIFLYLINFIMKFSNIGAVKFYDLIIRIIVIFFCYHILAQVDCRAVR